MGIGLAARALDRGKHMATHSMESQPSLNVQYLNDVQYLQAVSSRRRQLIKAHVPRGNTDLGSTD